jgi:predicted NUDIX family phosphoesterase
MMQPTRNHLQAAEAALRSANRPLTSKEIVDLIKVQQLADIGGATPWKTINARLSDDILKAGEKSAFKRTYHGRFSLREWNFEPEFVVKRRAQLPLNETIKAVPLNVLRDMIRPQDNELYQVDLKNLLLSSIDIVRSQAEERVDIVQLIPTFVIEDGESILAYKRTKRLPEARLHNTLCLNFGGHMQSEDVPQLFIDDNEILRQFFFRELYEELSFSDAPTRIEFQGLLYLSGSDFERQHVGIVYLVEVNRDTEFESLEPGMHVDLHKISIAELRSNTSVFDSWSAQLVRSLHG